MVTISNVSQLMSSAAVTSFGSAYLIFSRKDGVLKYSQ
jgi:hypothetical protein